MGRYTNSMKDTDRLNKSLDTLTEHLKNHKNVISRNNKELAAVNKELDSQRVDKIKILEEKLKKLELQTQWSQSSEPDINVTPDYLLKKLDIL